MDDFRGLIQKLDEIGELKVVRGADWNLEIGTITELMAERQGPALLFDEVKGFPRGFRIATNTTTVAINNNIKTVLTKANYLLCPSPNEKQNNN